MKIAILLMVSLACYASGQGSYVVFEDVGQVVTSIAYLHVAIPVNLPALNETIHQYREMIDGIFNQTHYRHPWAKHEDFKTQQYFDMSMTLRTMPRAMKDLMSMKTSFEKKHQRFAKRLEDLKAILHLDGSSIGSPDFSFRRNKRLAFLPALLAKGVFGTFMGLYHRSQYRQLQKELVGQIQEQNRLLMALITRINVPSIWSDSFGYMNLTSLFAPSRLLAQLSEHQDEIEDLLRTAADTIEIAQLHRLSISLFSGTQLADLFGQIKTRALELGAELLLDRPADLFQIETSYAYDGTDMTLVVHVPIASKSSILRLFKYHPFPLPFSDTHFLLPRQHHSLFAISSDEPRLSLDLDDSDLQGCYRMNGLYLCERLGVLNSRLQDSCLGALYTQRFKDAMSLCEMEVTPRSEQVLQMQDNWFLIYTPTAYTAFVTCRNHSSSEHHLKIGTNTIPVSPSCTLKLQDHVLFADTSLKTPSAMKQVQWNPEDVKFSEDEVAEAKEVLEAVRDEGVETPTLSDVRRLSANNKRSPRWLYFFILVGLLTFVALATWLFCFVTTHKFWLIRKALRTMVQHIWPSQNITRRGDALYEAVARHPPPEPSTRTRSTSISSRPNPFPRRHSAPSVPSSEDGIQMADARTFQRLPSFTRNSSRDLIPSTFRAGRIPL